MTAAAALLDGWRRVLRAPLLVAGVWSLGVALALPFALVLRAAIARHLGDSLAADTAASAVNFDWWNEFLAQSSGLGQTFTPSVIGFAAVLKNLSTIADSPAPSGTLSLVIAAHLAGSIFLLGGVLDRLARDRAIGTHGFFAACGVFFFRFLRLALIAGAAYAALIAWVHPWLFDDLYPAWTREVTVERTAFAVRLLFYAGLAAILAAINLLVDYAKIRMVVEDRRSAMGALIAAGRFVRRQPASVLALYLLNSAMFVAVLALYFVAAPGAGGSRIAIVAGFAISQLYIALRIVARLTFAASQIALFQGHLAHAGYTARPAARWPDSPAASAFGD
jgi:hypothetical protein